MMGPRQVVQGALFYEFSIEDHVPSDHLLRSIDRFVDLGGLRRHLAPFFKAHQSHSIATVLLWPRYQPETFNLGSLISFPNLEATKRAEGKEQEELQAIESKR